MTLATESNRKSYDGNDTTTDFSFPYKFLQDADLVVVLADSLGVETVQTLTTDYTVTGAGSESGGTVTMLTAPATGETLVIYRDVALTQITDLIEGGKFPVNSVEQSLDLLTMMVQQLNEQLGRSLTFPISSSLSDIELPPAAANEIIGWNDAATALVTYLLTDLSAYAISSFMQTLLDDTSAASGRTTLDAQQDIGSLSAANRLTLIKSMLDEFSPNDGDLVRYVDSAFIVEKRNASKMPSGLTLSNNATDATNDLDIAAGYAENSAGDKLLTLSSALVKRGDASWTAGTNQGGLSSSLTWGAASWYHVFIVEIGGAVDVLFDTSITCANGITDHSVTDYQYIGSIAYSSGILAGSMDEDRWWEFDTGITDVSNSGDATGSNYTVSVPGGDVFEYRGIFNINNGSGTSAGININRPGITTEQSFYIGVGGATTAGMVFENIVRSNTSSQIYLKTANVSALSVKGRAFRRAIY